MLLLLVPSLSMTISVHAYIFYFYKIYSNIIFYLCLHLSGPVYSGSETKITFVTVHFFMEIFHTKFHGYLFHCYGGEAWWCVTSVLYIYLRQLTVDCSWDNKSLACYRGGLGLNSCLSMWGIFRIGWHWDEFFKYFSYPLAVLFCQFSILHQLHSFIH